MGPDGRDRLYIPAKRHKTVLQHAHGNSTHQSISRVIDRLCQNIFIPGLRKIEEAYVRNCAVGLP